VIFLKHYSGNPEDLSLNFTVANSVRSCTESAISALNICSEFGVARTVDLKPNGSNTPATRDNKLEYIGLARDVVIYRRVRRGNPFLNVLFYLDPCSKVSVSTTEERR